MQPEPPGRAARSDAAVLSRAHSDGDGRSLRPCLATSIAPLPRAASHR